MALGPCGHERSWLDFRPMALPKSDREIVLLHNPRCSKSRETKALLEELGVAFRVRPYLDEPLSRGELADLAKRLGRPPAEWVRAKEAAYGAAGLSKASSAKELLDAMAEHPVLMERPIVVRGARAAVGRPSENVRELLDA